MLNRRDDPVAPLETARDLAAHIPGAQFAALEGDIHIPEFGDAPNRRERGAPPGPSIAPAPLGPAPLGLSPREVEVLRLLAAGLSNPAIAARLSLSVHTIKHHVVNLYTKLGIHCRADATAYALRHGLLPTLPTT